MEPKNTKDAIKLLPISEELKNDLLSRFDGMDIGEKHDVITAVWEAYDSLSEASAEAVTEERIKAILYGGKPPTENSLVDVAKELVGNVERKKADHQRDDDLVDVRSKLKSIISAT